MRFCSSLLPLSTGLLLLSPTAASTPLPRSSPWPHGGTYRCSPVGARKKAPFACGLPGPSGPGSQTPLTPGPGGSKGTPPGGYAGPARPPAGSPGPTPHSPGGPPAHTPPDWSTWWRFNADGFLDLKRSIHEGEVQTGSDDFFLGRGEKRAHTCVTRPTRAQIDSRVLPALERALTRERATDILTGALIALAKIDGEGLDRRALLIQRFLGDPNQEVSETATIALGILGDDRAAALLLRLLRDDPLARRLLGKSEVPYRTRAYAAYALGLVSQRTRQETLRIEIASALADLLDSPSFSTRDIKVAAMNAFGLCVLRPGPGGEAVPGSPRIRCREDQLEFLLDYFDPARMRANRRSRHAFVRAHAPVAMARLLAAEGRVDPRYRQRIAELLMEAAGSRSNSEREVRWGSIIGLGYIGNAAGSLRTQLDPRIRETLSSCLDRGTPQGRGLAAIALARVGSTPGQGTEGNAAEEQVANLLQGRLTRGGSLVRPWAGLAIGLFNRRLREAGRPLHTPTLVALLEEARRCVRPQEVGAYLIGLGLAGYAPAGPIALEQLARFKGDDEARGACAIALGLLHERAAIPALQAIVDDSRYRPDLLRRAAMALILLGDRSLGERLGAMLRTARGMATQASIASALGTIGDARSIEPLTEMLADPDRTDSARAFAAVALGIVCDKDALPWNSPLAVGSNYPSSPPTLTAPSATGILDIL